MTGTRKQFAVADARRLCRFLLEAVNDAVIIIEPASNRVIDANRSACRVYGYTKKELIGKMLQELTHEDTDYSHALHSGRPFERTDVAKDGQKIDLLVSLSLIDYWGRNAILSIIRDISERKRIEAVIAASEKRARLLIQGISEIVAVLDDKGAIQFISPQIQRVLGISPSEVLGHNVFEFLHSDDRDRAAAEFAKTLSEPGEAVPSVVRIKDHKNQWIPFEIIANNQLRDPAMKGVIFTARDLRFRMEAEQAIRHANIDFESRVEQRTIELAKANAALRIENQERRYVQTQLEHSVSLLNATLESTVDGILVVSNEGRITSFNQKFLDMWHIPRIAVTGLRTGELLSSVVPQLESSSEFLEELEVMEADPETVSFKQLKLKDGRIFERYSQPQRVNDKAMGRVWSFRDVTQARRLEEELRQSQKMEAIGRLAGGVAHDFNNVLMIISGCADQLRSDPDLPPQDHACCEQLVDATKRATALTRQLLAFSRKHPIQPQAVDLNATISELAGMLRPLLTGSIQLVINSRGENLIVHVDPSQLQLMIMNLALNARDAMPEGGILSLTTTAETLPADAVLPDGSRSFVVLEVTDTGAGMSQEIKERIFEPFFTTKGIGKGTGLGLAMAYGIVEQANGHITVESEPGHGTTFRIYLPLYTASIEEIPRLLDNTPGRGNATILLVEDERPIRTMTREYLEGLGYTVWKRRTEKRLCASFANITTLLLF
jgi:PAS domain S-box-containing protein